MLSKGIKLNLRIGRSDFSKAIGFSIAGWTCSILFAKAMMSLIGPLLLLACTVAMVVFSIKGLNKIFNTSLFNDEGSFYMALPLSEKHIVLSKLSAGSIYMLLTNLVTLLAALIMLLVFDIDPTDVGVEMLQEYLAANVPAGQISILMGMLPLKILLQQIFFCSFAMSVLLFFNLIKPGKLSVAAWLAIYGISTVFSTGISSLSSKLIGNGFNSLLLEGMIDILYLAIILALFFYCTKSLSSKYNV